MDYTQFIKPELLILIPVLMLIGKLIKFRRIDAKHIPVILGITGITLSCAWLIIIEAHDIPQALLIGIIQGILIAGAAVYSHQIFKQYCNNKNIGE